MCHARLCIGPGGWRNGRVSEKKRRWGSWRGGGGRGCGTGRGGGRGGERCTGRGGLKKRAVASKVQDRSMLADHGVVGLCQKMYNAVEKSGGCVLFTYSL